MRIQQTFHFNPVMVVALLNSKLYGDMVVGRDDAVRRLIFASMLMYRLDASKLAKR